jgi:hypothetical protein
MWDVEGRGGLKRQCHKISARSIGQDYGPVLFRIAWDYDSAQCRIARDQYIFVHRSAYS